MHWFPLCEICINHAMVSNVLARTFCQAVPRQIMLRNAKQLTVLRFPGPQDTPTLPHFFSFPVI